MLINIRQSHDGMHTGATTKLLHELEISALGIYKKNTKQYPKRYKYQNCRIRHNAMQFSIEIVKNKLTTV